MFHSFKCNRASRVTRYAIAIVAKLSWTLSIERQKLPRLATWSQLHAQFFFRCRGQTRHRKTQNTEIVTRLAKRERETATLDKVQLTANMKILLIGNYAPDRQESMLRFSHLLESELRARGHRVQLLQPRARLNRAGASPEGKAKWLGYIDKFVLFPALLKRAARRADIVHITDHSNAMYVRHLKNAPLLLTCNDVFAIRSALGLVPENPTSATGKVLQKLILNGLNRAPHIACISENTREQLLEVSSRSPDSTTVIEMGLNYPYFPMPAEEAEPFILHVGGNQWYKNRKGVLQIYRALCDKMGNETPRLVMAGKEFTPEMEDYCAQHNLGGVMRVEGASNEELRALYSRARAFIFPSLAEGFGWPIVEAQACGCRVMTTDLPPMNGIGGEAAVLCDPLDVAGAADQLRALLDEDETQCQTRVEAGLKNAERFTTASMVEQYERRYREIAHAA